MTIPQSATHRGVRVARRPLRRRRLCGMTTTGSMRIVGTWLLWTLAMPGLAHGASITTEYGIDFVTVGDPGNRATDATLDAAPLPGIEGDLWLSPGMRVGAVDYRYRIARTELTVGQWFEFVQAYWPHYDGVRNDPAFSSNAIFIGFDGSPGLVNGYALDQPVEVSFEYAARYANWLHNNKAGEAWAFESGAYETSTFTENADGSTNHQLTHSPGARFWIPTEDEYVKAAYWDPTKGADGGYWMYPNGADTPPAPGSPEDGGMTNAGGWFNDYPRAVGSYPDQVSPWGLLDTSGGAEEMLETRQATTNDSHWVRGTSLFQGGTDFTDRLDFRTTNSVFGVGGGIRLVTAVPAPSVGCACCSLLVCFIGRRR